MNTGADILSGILSRTYYGNTVLDYLVFLLVMVVGLVAAKILTAVATRSARRLAGKTATVLDDFLIGVIKKTASPLLYYGVFYIATRNLVLPGAIARAVYVLGVILLTVMAIRFLTAVLVYAMENYWLKGAEDGKRRSVLGLMPAIKTVIWAMGIVFLLDNLGFEISTVIAGLGIGGIAVAMASQAILGDLFSYFAILTDRPFEVG
ncbi:MAG: mechanosensitive ion channel family protein, partial [Thermodesulfobacteriota bacterium]